MRIKNKHAVGLGRLGGSVASESQKEAARKNGLLGGRPKTKKGMGKNLSDEESIKIKKCPTLTRIEKIAG